MDTGLYYNFKEGIIIDILVTIPKAEYNNFYQELEDMYARDLLGFWTLSKAPKHAHIKDRVYFLINKKIEYSMEIMEIKNNSEMTCSTTNRKWSGQCQLILDNLRKESFDVEISGFMGFRYMDKLNILTKSKYI